MISLFNRHRSAPGALACVVCATLASTLLASLALASPVAASAPATVIVRVEGATETLVPPTQVTTTTEPVVKDGKPEDSCPGTSAIGALQLATAGNWSGPWSAPFKQYEIAAIEGESHAFGSGAFWNLWVNHVSSETGACEAQLETGEEVLLYPESECFGECPTPPSPLGVLAPPVAEVGRPVGVTVTSYANPSGAQTAAKGATVAYEGTSTGTDANGHATLTFAHAGSMTVRVSAPDAIRTETTVCVHQGNDGTCGTQTVSGPGGPVGGAAGTGVDGISAPYKGPYALVPHLTSLIDGHTYTRAHAPRILAGSISAHTTVSSVSLTLRRGRRGRCWAFDGVTIRFVRARCGTGRPFTVSSNGVFSYLLPAALPAGRYVLDIGATDAAGNHTTLARGTSRIVFYVR